MMMNLTAKRHTERNGKSVFFAMKIAAWAALCVGLCLCLIRMEDFSDNNAFLMSGIGFMVGSVFIYTIGMAINLVDERNETE
ncbi:hypothetical protein [Paenibacillus montanisoli]|uniref:Uncharacterized protein n=1 Tax=Paenibacillus montanisoli TaxID=2081970 RepID=A0A328TS90_9BACL|nr:hypothetical protein [Paenibacillus montanisoli]RAP73429.1 hypothetical protein DL346_27390 [Paenibacillus montanisoli]